MNVILWGVLAVAAGVLINKAIDWERAWGDSKYPEPPYPLEFRIAQAINQTRSPDHYVSAQDILPIMDMFIHAVDRNMTLRRPPVSGKPPSRKEPDQ